MADGFDRNDNDNNGGGSFVMGLLTGTVLGAGLGMLFAPEGRFRPAQPGAGTGRQSGEHGVRRLSSGGRNRRRVREVASADTANQYAERGRDMAGDLAGRAREAVAKGTEEAQRYVRDASGGASDMTDTDGDGVGQRRQRPELDGISSGPRPAGSYPNDSTSHPGGSQSGSGGFGGSRG